MDYDWHDLLFPADEWIINYAVPPHSLGAVKLFSIGHALELYLKACYTKLTGNIDCAIKFGHRIPDIWAACKKLDSNFLLGKDLRRSILKRNLFSGSDCAQLSPSDWEHFQENSEFYLVCKYLADLKYLEAPLKGVDGPISYFYGALNLQGAALFHELRLYLQYPGRGQVDILRYYSEERPLSDVDTVAFLRDIVNGWASRPIAPPR